MDERKRPDDRHGQQTSAARPYTIVTSKMSTYLFHSAIKSMPKGWKVTTMTSTPNAWTRSRWTIVQSVLAFLFFFLKVWLLHFEPLAFTYSFNYFTYLFFASDIIFIIYMWTKKRRQLGHCCSQLGHPSFPQVSYGSLKCHACFVCLLYEAETKAS